MNKEYIQMTNSNPEHGYFIFGDLHSDDLGISVTGAGTYRRPKRDLTFTPIPGRSGDVVTDHKRYNNVEIYYDCSVIDDFANVLDAITSYGSTVTDYVRLEDSYDPEHFRMGVLSADIDPEALRPDRGRAYRAGNFRLTFNCKPQRYLKAGALYTTYYGVYGAYTLYNPTRFEASPIIRYRQKTRNVIIINGTPVEWQIKNIPTADLDKYTAYIDFESESGWIEGYDDGEIEITATEFPKLQPGENSITTYRGDSVDLMPRWYTI